MTFADTKSNSPNIRILAISGSLRQASSNTALLEAALLLSPQNVEMKLYSGLGNLPHFNPDLEPMEPFAVTDLRTQLRWSDGLLISSPEYAHGVPGVLKNALDWLVSGEEFVGKPIALFNASPRAVHAQASLIEIVTTMAGRVVPEASITVSLLGKKLDAAQIVADSEMSSELQSAISVFANAILQLMNHKQITTFTPTND
ncbi:MULTISPECIES: NADPH-dependent FMN reductase [unclassified Microcoleus]|uniref:NADPH-dependent FMN reductase n=1 Tax=unclassified Microcoleus TaxID=2642155 RepID=UPI001D2106D6|nr:MULTISPECIES: NADPH-dependent FMN reductase [unclassified Microcoleus]MCC3471233.1 NAD(P)H-dependent oxidoreductase [Microcoleus sp. PH2017_13_LAR_U_A]MCC3483887.1 NAD(P)H-dependent oxidoreductase [Microcoleus sp. PH2017_14_LAR_D_A]MCC3595430.1 NAD(P)H-dependent oxidoreductase [Microcoleus sp. PH2017_26_ELK_O_A]MCC3620553.1 NAD(P)H-dependent oxidoreductase [Microcoleus sp. PH2017_36_ELK_O_B]